ncbi:MAG: hypothetical protein ACM31E_06455 [Fibrobacterota bacterium]|nr:hypothetical protein [Chitinispirillaceae bacterium]
MRIASSNVELASEQIDLRYSSVYERLHKWDKKSDVTIENSSEAGKTKIESIIKKDVLELSKQARAQGQAQNAQTAVPVQASSEETLDELFGSEVDDIKMRIVRDMVEMFTGKKIKVFDSRELHRKLASGDSIDMPQQAQQNAQAAQNGPQREGWGIDYFRREVHQTKEGFSFSAQGSVTTADGKDIQFSAALEMSRETYKEVTTSIKDGDALIDPLVVNFSGAGTQLTNVKFEFDLDSDGTNEMISVPSSGSGLLAYDKNGNGVIDDGTELFGPSSGNGFIELASLDDDKNGWIDENDTAFTKIKVWEKTTDGSDVVSSLLSKDIGAIYTGSAHTTYSLYNNNALSGQIRESGVWLHESSGNVGTIQEIDLVA